MTGPAASELMARVMAAADAGDAPAGLALAREAVQRAPDDPVLRVTFGFAAERADRPEDAIDAYLTALTIAEASSGELQEQCASRLLSLLVMRPERSLQVINRLVQLGERATLSGSAMHLLGRLLASRGLADRAMRLAGEHLLARGLGWRRSIGAGLSVDAAGQPLPLYTYPCIAYLEQFDWSGRVVFEYGAGQSTLYWATHCRSVHAVDNDHGWVERLQASAPANAHLLFAEGEAFVKAVLGCPEPPDLIAIDGRGHRYDCAGFALQRLQPGGAILLDNAEWHPETARRLRQADLIEVDFAGLKPTEFATSVTSLFLHRDFRLQPRDSASPAVPAGGRVLHSQWDKPG